MEVAYNAANTLEAQIVKDVLSTHDISARIDGEYLQGGVGELQALGLVRVLVERVDYPRARQIMDEWDARSDDSAIPNASAPERRSSRRVLAGVILGVVLALVALFLAAR